MIEHFTVGEFVTWKTPEDQKYWDSQYRHLTRTYGSRSFTVAKTRISKYRKTDQDVALASPDGTPITKNNSEDLAFFPSTWLKRVI
jgi:hypothetical protein